MLFLSLPHHHFRRFLIDLFTIHTVIVEWEKKFDFVRHSAKTFSYTRRYRFKMTFLQCELHDTTLYIFNLMLHIYTKFFFFILKEFNSFSSYDVWWLFIYSRVGSKGKMMRRKQEEERKTIRHGVNINQNLLQIILDFEIFMSWLESIATGKSLPHWNNTDNFNSFLFTILMK